MVFHKRLCPKELRSDPGIAAGRGAPLAFWRAVSSGGEPMLRITPSTASGARELKLEGKLMGPWVAELAGACRTEGDHRPLRLDLQAVSFVDHEGTLLLRELLGRGVEVACSGLVAELLFGEVR
jgi:hypothetical protein